MTDRIFPMPPDKKEDDEKTGGGAEESGDRDDQMDHPERQDHTQELTMLTDRTAQLSFNIPRDHNAPGPLTFPHGTGDAETDNANRDTDGASLQVEPSGAETAKNGRGSLKTPGVRLGDRPGSQTPISIAADLEAKDTLADAALVPIPPTPPDAPDEASGSVCSQSDEEDAFDDDEEDAFDDDEEGAFLDDDDDDEEDYWPDDAEYVRREIEAAAAEEREEKLAIECEMPFWNAWGCATLEEYETLVAADARQRRTHLAPTPPSERRQEDGGSSRAEDDDGLAQAVKESLRDLDQRDASFGPEPCGSRPRLRGDRCTPGLDIEGAKGAGVGEAELAYAMAEGEKGAEVRSDGRVVETDGSATVLDEEPDREVEGPPSPSGSIT